MGMVFSPSEGHSLQKSSRTTMTGGNVRSTSKIQRELEEEGKAKRQAPKSQQRCHEVEDDGL